MSEPEEKRKPVKRLKTTKPTTERQNVINIHNNIVNNPNKSIGKKILIVVGVILAFIFVVALLANMATSAPLVVSDKLVADIQDSNSSAAYDLLSSDAQNTISSQDFEATVDKIGPILSGKPNIISKEVSSDTDSGSTAKVVYEIKGSDDVIYRFTVNLVENDGKWEVLNFESTDKNKSPSSEPTDE